MYMYISLSLYIYIYIHMLYIYIYIYIYIGMGWILPRRKSLPQIRQRELPRTSEVCPYIVKDLILRTSEAFVPRG